MTSTPGSLRTAKNVVFSLEVLAYRLRNPCLKMADTIHCEMTYCLTGKINGYKIRLAASSEPVATVPFSHPDCLRFSNIKSVVALEVSPHSNPLPVFSVALLEKYIAKQCHGQLNNIISVIHLAI